MTQPIITLRNVTKRYGTHTIVNHARLKTDACENHTP